MDAIILLAEIVSYGLDLTIEGSEVYLIGNAQNLPGTLRRDIRENLGAMRELIEATVTA